MKLHGIDLTFPEFDQKQVLEWTGLNAATLQNWANRGIIQLKPSRPGKRQRRLYSAMDVIKLLCIFELSRLGVMPAFASDFADKAITRRLVEKIEEREREQKTGKTEFGTAKKAIFYWKNGEIEYKIRGGSAKNLIGEVFADGFSEDIPVAKIEFSIDEAIYKIIRNIMNDNMKFLDSKIAKREPDA
ncbi:MAG: MerR family transcriptional regulator [Geminicoccaceae bacterium]|nr:MerR family transcriptional regulator [Geminicoccaceae bacterium]